MSHAVTRRLFQNRRQANVLRILLCWSRFNVSLDTVTMNRHTNTHTHNYIGLLLSLSARSLLKPFYTVSLEQDIHSSAVWLYAVLWMKKWLTATQQVSACVLCWEAAWIEFWPIWFSITSTLHEAHIELLSYFIKKLLIIQSSDPSP
jgi:hypothetical protein